MVGKPHLDLLQLVGSAVHLCDHNVGMVGILLAQLVPRWARAAAMSTPRGIKLDQHVLLGIHGDLVEVLANQNLYASRVPVLGNLLRHQVLLQLSSQELGNKGLDILGLDLVVLRLVLSHVLSQLDGSEGGSSDSVIPKNSRILLWSSSSVLMVTKSILPLFSLAIPWSMATSSACESALALRKARR